MRKNKIKEFFKFTIGKVALTLIIGLIFFILSIICSPLYFFPGPFTLQCGLILSIILTLPYRLPITVLVYLAIIYTVSCLIAYIWRNIEKNAKRK